MDEEEEAQKENETRFIIKGVGERHVLETIHCPNSPGNQIGQFKFLTIFSH